MPRSPERQALADAIAKHSAATEHQNRVELARQRLEDDLYGTFQPTVAAARRAIAEAREIAPEMLIDRVLRNESISGGVTVAQSQTMLADAERRVEEARAARRLMVEEAVAADQAVARATTAVDAAVRAVIAADRVALLREYHRVGTRFLQLAQALRSTGFSVALGAANDVNTAAKALGLAGPGDLSAPDAAFVGWVQALPEDADAQLPALPPEPPEPDRAAAA
jgi:hypothetical protein